MRDFLNRTTSLMVSSVLTLVISGCISLPKSFKEEGAKITHQPTGISYPKKIKGWSLREGARENPAENIAAMVPYEIYNFKKGSAENTPIPKATVYLLPAANTEISVVKTAAAKDLPELTELREEKIITPRGEARATVYGYTEVFDPLPTIKVTTHKVDYEAWLVSLPAEKQMALWITVGSKNPQSAIIAQDFVQKVFTAAP